MNLLNSDNNSIKKKWMVIRLSGPMMSWGYGKKSHRPTAQYPSKSAIVGIFGSSMNISRNDEISIKEIASTEMHIFAIKLGIQLTDYHTVGCGTLCENDIPMTVDSSVDRDEKEKRTVGKQIVTHLDYLSDADFVVICENNEEFIDRYALSIKYPYRPLFLGRKSYLPSRPIFDGVYESSDGAMGRLRQIAKEAFPKQKNISLPVVSDVSNIQEADDFLMDFPIRFGVAMGGFKRRAVKHGQIKMEF